VHQVELAAAERGALVRRQRPDQPARGRIAARARRRQRQPGRLVEDGEAVAEVDEARGAAQCRRPQTK
jgi:hypothetical protein